MAYATRADIENRFGVENVRKWSNLENAATTADEVRIALALEWADAQINRRFGGSSFGVPLVASSSAGGVILRDWAARLAGVWLYDSRGASEVDEAGRPAHRMDHHRREVMREIGRVLAGLDTLDVVQTVSTSPTAPVVVEDPWPWQVLI